MVHVNDGHNAVADPRLVFALDARDSTELVRLATEAVALRWPQASTLFLSLGLVGRVVIDEDRSQTACVTANLGTNRFHISLGDQFVRNVVLTPMDLGYVLCHEMVHLLSLHLSAPSSTDCDSQAAKRYQHIVHNLAADAIVARQLHERLGVTPGIDRRAHGPGTSIFNALVGTPETLLDRRHLVGDPLPKQEIGGAFRARALRQGLEMTGTTVSSLVRWYHRIWTLLDVPSLDSAYRELLPLLKPYADFLAQPPLQARLSFGNPSSRFPSSINSESVSEAVLRAMPDEVLELLGEKPSHKKGSEGGPAGECEEIDLAPGTSSAVEKLASLLRDFMRRSPALACRETEEGDSSLSSPVPLRLGRKEAFWLSMGLRPPLFPLPNPRREEPPVPVYVDVSGSTKRHWRPIIKAMVSIAGTRTILAYQFSTEVYPLPMNSNVYRVRSHGGTNFDCVARHMLEAPGSRRHSFIITDGDAALLEPLQRKLTRVGASISVVLLAAETKEEKDRMERTFGALLGRGAGLLWIPRELLR